MSELGLDTLPERRFDRPAGNQIDRAAQRLLDFVREIVGRLVDRRCQRLGGDRHIGQIAQDGFARGRIAGLAKVQFAAPRAHVFADLARACLDTAGLSGYVKKHS